jgi:hypothetical protein
MGSLSRNDNIIIAKQKNGNSLEIRRRAGRGEEWVASHSRHFMQLLSNG